MNFFTELKRRNVIRAAGLYLVGAWLLTKVPIALAKVIDLPNGCPFRFKVRNRTCSCSYPSLAAKESARDGCALPVESRLNG